MGEPFFGWQTIYGVDGEHRSPYMTRGWIGRLRLHIFHRGDNDPDPHDHPWSFWTFPLTAYVEEVTEWACSLIVEGHCKDTYFTRIRTVRAFRPHYRSANYTHRVIGPVKGSGRIITVVWRGRSARRWGFLKHRDGKWCWVHWKEYIYGGGKTAPCEPVDQGKGEPHV